MNSDDRKNSVNISEFSAKLISWYELHKRDLPWRHTNDPYIIWISEIILQQTRVSQGYGYFLRFIHRFPDIESLANAKEDDVLKFWQGLGYYSRARNLHKAARSMNGVFPDTYEKVMAIKGVGEYTAAAICSISYNLPHAVVDGNVYRVLARYFDIDTPIDSNTGKKEFKKLAQELIDVNRPALYNQAIMEFGALQCTPQNPSCTACPLSESCLALSNNKIKELPVKKNKIKILNRYLNYMLVRSEEYIFIRKRTGKDIWFNLYELPLIETDDSVTEEDFYNLPAFYNLFLTQTPHIRLLEKDVKHVLSHRILHTNFYEIILPADTPSFPGHKKIHINSIDEYAFPRLIQTFLERWFIKI